MNKKISFTKEYLENQYYILEKSVKEIATENGVGINRIVREFKRFNIKCRDRKERNRIRSSKTSINLECSFCKKEFRREKWRLRNTQKYYCSIKCSAKGMKKPEPFTNLDKYSPYRVYLKNIKSHKRYKKGIKSEYYITLEDLKKQWEKQNGRCAYAGIALKNPRKYKLKGKRIPLPPLTFDRASLDRIDSSQPYTKENIEFVCLMAQYCKNIFSKEEVIAFCHMVALNHQKPFVEDGIFS